MEKIAVIDLFCGAGGTTTGIERAKMFGKKIAKVIACVNHDAMAIKSHRFNHKGVLHFTEDIRTLNLDRLIKLVDKYRAMGYRVAIWASLECTNFSNAKGGAPRDADSRTLAEHLLRYIYGVDPDYVFIENVMEFMSWGPLNESGRPISRDKGVDYIKWRDSIQSIGYHHDWAKLDSADFGARTSRKRYFGVFAKLSLPISFPKPTHSKDPNKSADLFSKPLKKWKPVKDMLDLEDEGNSIFERKKELSCKTLERIYAGLIKYVAGGKEHFIQQYNSGSDFHRVKSVNEPVNTITTNNRFALVKTDYLTKYHGTGKNILSVDDTCSTITTKDRLAKVSVTPFIDKQYSGPHNHQSIENPLGVIMVNDKNSLVTPLILNYNSSTSPVTNAENPCPTITVARTHYLVNPSWFGNPGDVEKPCPTIVARQDKAPLYLIATKQGDFNIPVYDTDSEIMVKIKQFMSLYGIVDIKMRMLKVSELLRIQGFPSKYILKGNQSQQKKFIGNSVVPLVAELLIKQIYKSLCEHSEIKTAA